MHVVYKAGVSSTLKLGISALVLQIERQTSYTLGEDGKGTFWVYRVHIVTQGPYQYK